LAPPLKVIRANHVLDLANDYIHLRPGRHSASVIASGSLVIEFRGIAARRRDVLSGHRLDGLEAPAIVTVRVPLRIDDHIAGVSSRRDEWFWRVGADGAVVVPWLVIAARNAAAAGGQPDRFLQGAGPHIGGMKIFLRKPRGRPAAEHLVDPALRPAAI